MGYLIEWNSVSVTYESPEIITDIESAERRVELYSEVVHLSYDSTDCSKIKDTLLIRLAEFKVRLDGT